MWLEWDFQKSCCYISIYFIDNSIAFVIYYSTNPYESVDPAPPAPPASTSELRSTLLNPKLPLFERYRALFALRNKGDPESVLVREYIW